jgi:hypothetical protein
MTIQTPPDPDAQPLPQWGEPGYQVPRRKLTTRANTHRGPGHRRGRPSGGTVAGN